MSLKFGEFDLDQERRQLLRSGRPVPLEPKAYELLSLLVERRPRALSRAQIRDVVWPDTFVSESTLGVEVNAIRQALGDDARDPRFIRTVRGFGYAFCGEVDESEDRRSGPVREEARSEGVGAGGRRRRARLWGALGALLVATAVGWWALSTRSPDSPAGPITITPLTSDGGGKACPRLSPDGERVAYSWTGAADDNWDIYVKAVGIGTRPLRLTEYEGRDCSPVWSPDGRQIAFLRRVDEQVTIFTVPSLGGQERRLIEVAGPSFIYNYYDHSDLSWSPDGRTLAYAESAAEHEPARIVLLSLDSMEKHALTSPAARTLGDQQPAFSPDGTQVAFVRSEVGADTLSHRDVWVQAVDGGDARRLTREEYDGCDGPAWTSDGTEILFSAGSASYWVYRVAATGGPPELVAGLGQWAITPSIRGERLVHEQAMALPPRNIVRIPGPQASRRDPVAEVLIASGGGQNAAYSPDGRRIAFESDRSGHPNIWVCDRDGSHPMPLTDFRRLTGTPRWSPDSRWLTLDSVDAGDWNVYIIDADGHRARRLTPETSTDVRGVWSRDGRWVFFISDRGGTRQVWRVPAEEGPAVQVTRGGAAYAEASWDGAHLYYANTEFLPGLWRVPVDGGEEAEVVPGPLPHALDWALSATSLVYAMEEPRARGEVYTVHSLDLTSGEVTELFRRDGAFHHETLTVSSDGEWVLFGENELGDDELTLVEGFR